MTGVTDMEARTSWEDAVDAWPQTRAHSVLRAYGDELNARLAEDWLAASPRPRTLLKTDLFDKAVGAGLYPRLVALADSVTAIDISSAVVDAARRRYPQINAIRADVRKLSFRDGSFETVVSFSTLDHFDAVADLHAGLAELVRVLSAGGRLLVTLDNATNPLVALRNWIHWRALAAVRLVPCYVGATYGLTPLVDRLTSLDLEILRAGTLMHVPRIGALALGAVWPRRDSVVRHLLACERLRQLPNRNLTAQFVAVLAVKPE